MSAILELQKKCGVTADGVWGPGTYKAASCLLYTSDAADDYSV